MNDSMYLIDEFVTVTPGKVFRLFPFGRIVKGGKIREITKEIAAKFRLPHFKPPIKLGSHDEKTPAGGHIVALEVRDDGLYAVPEYTDGGNEALEKGAYRYHSPEVIWDGWLEDPKTGDKLEGPMIVGDALLHTPHLGEEAALYHVESVQGDTTMTMETNEDMVSVSTLDKLFGWFQTTADNVQQEPEPVTQPDPQEDYEAKLNDAQAKADEYAAKVAEFEAAQQRQERVTHFAAEFDGVEVNSDLFGILADVPEEAAEQLTTMIKALAEQARVSNLTTDVGNSGGHVEGDATAVFDAAVKKVMNEQEISYPKAMDIVQREQPEVFNAWYGGGK